MDRIYIRIRRPPYGIRIIMKFIFVQIFDVCLSYTIILSCLPEDFSCDGRFESLLVFFLPPSLFSPSLLDSWCYTKKEADEIQTKKIREKEIENGGQ